MANGRALPSALLFDWLLGRAWNMAMSSYANAHNLSGNDLGGSSESGVSTGASGPTIEKFLTRYAGDEPAALVAAHDQALRWQMQDVANYWAAQFNDILTKAVPIGPGFVLAIQWLRGVVNGADGLGYLGQDRRLAQAQGYAAQNVNPRGLPLPPGTLTALQSVSGRMAGLHVDRLAVQMTADRQAEAHKLRVDAAEALLKAYNEALDAVMDYIFTQMHLMFDVFGRNNDFLVRLQRERDTIQARMQVRTAELAEWNERIMTTDDSHAASIQRIKSSVERANTKAQMAAESNIKLLRRYSSRAASALNSAGVSVQSTASESNSINAGV